MPKLPFPAAAEGMPKITRRAALGGLASLPLAIVAGAAVSKPVLTLPSIEFVRQMQADGYKFSARGDLDDIDSYAIRRVEDTGDDNTLDLVLALIRRVSA